VLLRRQLGGVDIRLVDGGALERGRARLEQREDLRALRAVALERHLGLPGRTAGLGGATVMATAAVAVVAVAVAAVAADERDVRRVQRWTDRLGILHAHPTLDAFGAGRVVDRQQPAPLLHGERRFLGQAEALALDLGVEAVEVEVEDAPQWTAAEFVHL